MKRGKDFIDRQKFITEQTCGGGGAMKNTIDPIHAVKSRNQASFSWIERHTEGDGTKMLRHDLCTDAQICGKSASQASLFVQHGRGVNRVY